ncbi:Aste57867_15579 [Aphanomyces stellatus]|uniref:Aste57867_15579 protein n=1 Tax=Aphanomyces stellatus TaxID=120398 RepID=A0A485L3G3_9STRA|nr:hypothetical protein As57867_015523 [Aphanomyces stellatus]VFT92381.1 Aste57867_15579 [Aphanomyces stellatus]
MKATVPSKSSVHDDGDDDSDDDNDDDSDEDLSMLAIGSSRLALQKAKANKTTAMIGNGEMSQHAMGSWTDARLTKKQKQERRKLQTELGEATRRREVGPLVEVIERTVANQMDGLLATVAVARRVLEAFVHIDEADQKTESSYPAVAPASQVGENSIPAKDNGSTVQATTKISRVNASSQDKSTRDVANPAGAPLWTPLASVEAPPPVAVVNKAAPPMPVEAKSSMQPFSTTQNQISDASTSWKAPPSVNSTQGFEMWPPLSTALGTSSSAPAYDAPSPPMVSDKKDHDAQQMPQEGAPAVGNAINQDFMAMNGFNYSPVEGSASTQQTTPRDHNMANAVAKFTVIVLDYLESHFYYPHAYYPISHVVTNVRKLPADDLGGLSVGQFTNILVKAMSEHNQLHYGELDSKGRPSFTLKVESSSTTNMNVPNRPSPSRILCNLWRQKARPSLSRPLLRLCFPSHHRAFGGATAPIVASHAPQCPSNP